ncbi:MAG: valine--tRNA ligase [Verrucomicrobiota bacterium]
MSELPKTYEPQAIEEKWYSQWLASHSFEGRPERVSPTRPAYSIVIPPPNVTGVLTLGHVLNNTIQDILARRARMLGKEVLWLPGTDHAGIATQTVVERTLKKQGAIRHRDDLGRDKFLEKVWEWKDKHGGIIIQQLKKLGASCDWNRERFTMDPEYSACVQRVFVDLFRKGAIYRGKRMVNWCPVSRTALSDEEVVMKAQSGSLTHFRVEIAERPGTFLTIATTRPETIPGDSAVAVNPADPRYAEFIGLHVVRPLPSEQPREQRLIPIIGDAHVEFGFGTGVLKVTPAHDKADFDIGLRHGLAAIDIMNPDGTMNALAGEGLADKDRFEARTIAIAKLTELGLLDKEEPHQNNVGFSERADVPIEPRLSQQWFLKYPSVEASREVVSSSKMRFYPDRWAKVYDHWLEGIQDWCISRQLWWGHRIPVWYFNGSDEAAARAALGFEIPAEALRVLEDGSISYCGLETPSDTTLWTQDNDVLDTWFSSWLWPFATMGWPESTETLKTFYPTTDLVTGPDIIFFWVARMIMAGFEYIGELPFKNVYFTGIIRDKQGRKMSKSLGNSPDPLDLIAKFGADALRFGVMRSAPLGQDVLFDEKNVELGRNFCTKLWNACRFRQMQGGSVEGEIRSELLSTEDKWILLRLDKAIAEVSTALDEYRFSDAAQALYRFFWSEYCDWYVESSKAALTGTDSARKENTLAVIDFVLAHTLRLFHPFMPFITEELWHGLGFHQDLPADQGGESIMRATWPKPLGDDFHAHYGLLPEDETRANAKFDVVLAGRGLRRDFNIASNKKITFVLKAQTPLSDDDRGVIQLLLNAESLEIVDTSWTPPRGTPTSLTPFGPLFLPLEGLVDMDAERERIGKEITKIEQELTKVRAKLSSETFVNGAPANVVAEHRQRESDWQTKLSELQRLQEALT